VEVWNSRKVVCSIRIKTPLGECRFPPQFENRYRKRSSLLKNSFAPSSNLHSDAESTVFGRFEPGLGLPIGPAATFSTGWPVFDTHHRPSRKFAFSYFSEVCSQLAKRFEKKAYAPLAIHWGFIGPCFAGGAWLDMYTLSLFGDRGAGGALGNSR
jgi:hypothetical protein